MPSAPRPTQAKNATSAMLCRVFASSGSSGAPKSLRRTVSKDIMQLSAGWRRLVPAQALREHFHLFGRLPVALGFGRCDAALERLQRLLGTAFLRKGLAEQLPRRGVVRVPRKRLAQMGDRARAIAG